MSQSKHKSLLVLKPLKLITVHPDFGGGSCSHSPKHKRWDRLTHRLFHRFNGKNGILVVKNCS